MRSALRGLAWLGAVALGLVTLASFLDDVSWRLELFSHFRPHLALASLVALLLAGVARTGMPAAMLAVALAANAAPLLPRLVAAAAAEADCRAPEGLRVLTFNLEGRFTDPAAFAALIAAERPDVVLLTELPADLSALLAAVPDLPHRVVDRQGSIFDVALFSRWPVTQANVDRGVSRFLPVLSADLCPAAAAPGESCIRLVGLHATQPMHDANRPQDAQLARAADAAAAAPGGRVVLLGDLNLTPWSPRFGRLRDAGGFADDAARHRGLDATWISASPVVGLALDHVLTGPGMRVACSRLGPDLGSDHLPVIADLTIRGAASGAAAE